MATKKDTWALGCYRASNATVESNDGLTVGCATAYTTTGIKTTTRNEWNKKARRNGWRPEHMTSHIVLLARDWYDMVYLAGLDSHDMLTIAAKTPKPLCAGWTVTPARWLVRGRGYSYTVADGVIARDTATGRLVHAADAACVKRIVAKIHQSQALDVSSADLRRAWATCPELVTATYNSVSVTRSDSIAAGNCPTGTDSWIAHRGVPVTVAVCVASSAGGLALRAAEHAILRGRGVGRSLSPDGSVRRIYA